MTRKSVSGGAMALLLAVLLSLGVGHGTSSQAVGNSFVETFDGSPAGPLPFSSPDWDVAVHSRDTGTWYQLEAMDMQHGPDCTPPMATHHSNGAYADAVFLCKDHVMTAIQAGG